MNDPTPRWFETSLPFLTTFGSLLGVIWWLLVGGTAALWWVPAFFGAAKPLTWQYGVVMLLVQWVWVFNRWPRVGTRRFFHENRFLRLQFVLLGVISGLFALGFALVA